MGASNSKIEEDKALQLCRERKKFVKLALDGRCSLAAAHFMYIQSLKNTGTALRKFVDLGAPVESSLYTATSATPELLVQTGKSLSQFSFSSPSVSQRIDAAETFFPSPSPPNSTRFQANHMKFRGSFSKTVEEKPPIPLTATVTSSSTPQNTTPRSAGKPETSPIEASSLPPQTPPWDYFDFFHPIDHQFSFQEGKGRELTRGLKITMIDSLGKRREFLIWKMKKRRLLFMEGKNLRILKMNLMSLLQIPLFEVLKILIECRITLKLVLHLQCLPQEV
ncbi:hypothetical protein TB1_006402 [Malus domestica]